LIHDPDTGKWSACVDRALGDHAWALLVPVSAQDGAWRVAAPPASVLHLHRVSPVPRRLDPPEEAQDPTHYLCLLCYDYPEERPGSTFGLSFHPVRLTGSSMAAAFAPARGANDDKVAVAELQAALDMLQRYFLEGLLLQLLPAEAVENAAAGRPGPEPEPEGSALTFAFASCQYPAGLMDRHQATASYRALARAFPAGTVPTRLLLLGDQVYTDATYGLLEPTRLDDRYRRPYEELASRHGPLGQLPQHFQRVILTTPDDHEIRDDWEPDPKLPADTRYDRGVRAYWRHQRGVGEQQAKSHARSGKPIWRMECPPVRGAGPSWRLFMTDSRTVRDPRDEDSVGRALILGEPQTLALMQWLLDAPPEDLKIITSAAMLLPRTLMHVDEPLHQDNWQGFPASLYSLLVHLCENEIPNVVFLSGDAHLACSARITVTHAGGKRCEFHSHHAPPLYAPYPFANETRHNLLLDDDFDFTWKNGAAERTYHCHVEAGIPDATPQGYSLLRAAPGPAGWETRVEVVSSRQPERPRPGDA
jgi:hypothetical protein